MNTLYIFAIGGTGERVMRSLVMLLAAGAKTGAKTIVPVFVDNDEKSKALDDCRKLLSYYQTDPSKNGDGNSGMATLIGKASADWASKTSFFQTRIADPVYIDISGEGIGDMSTLFKNLPKNNETTDNILAERDLLYTNDDVKMPLSVGFVGNPNIGSLILSGISFETPAFSSIFEQVDPGDGVIVIGSLFGGTGAAGIPLIVKRFRSKGTGAPLIGALSVLPYFKFGSGDTCTQRVIDTSKYDVDASSFTDKTRAALMYYDEYLVHEMDYCYYVGDDNQAEYPHKVGGCEQDNPPQLTEIMAAMSVIDFSKQQSPRVPGHKVTFKRPKWGFVDNKYDLSNLPGILDEDIRRSIVKFQLLKMFFENNGTGMLMANIENRTAYAHDTGISETERLAVVDYGHDATLNQYRNAWALRNMFVEWEKWLDQLNERTKAHPRNVQCIDNDKARGTESANCLTGFTTGSVFGAAATVIKNPLFGRRHTVAVDAQLTDFILNAYRKLNSPTAPTQVTDNTKLPLLLALVSMGVDEMFAQKKTADI